MNILGWVAVVIVYIVIGITVFKKLNLKIPKIKFRGDTNEMARNLVKENRQEAPTAAQAKAYEAEMPKPEAGNMQVITTEQLLINNLNAIAAMLQDLKVKVEEGFKQVGVEFKDK